MRDDAQELADSLDLEQWFEREGISFKRTRGSSGPQLNICECPACGDRRWRIYLNAESGRGNCFVCNATFSKLGFIHRCLGNDPQDTSPTGKRAWSETFKNVRATLAEQGWRPRRVTEVAVEPGEVVLPDSFELPTPEGQNLVYLESRGISGELAHYFHLRFCNSGSFRYNREDGRKAYQTFDGRLIIPVYDLDGAMKTFQGRDVTGVYEASQKYLFPIGLPGTGRYLFNGQSAGLTRRVVMGEGAFDVMALKKAFDEESSLRDVVPIGSFGKHLSYGSIDGNDQLGRFIQLKRGRLEEVTIMWDGEVKALAAALDAAELLRRIELRVRIATLPFEKDPNEVLPATVREVFQNARDYTAALNIEWRLRNPYAGR